MDDFQWLDQADEDKLVATIKNLCGEPIDWENLLRGVSGGYVRDNLPVEDSVERYRDSLPQQVPRLNTRAYLEGGEVPLAVVLKNAFVTYKGQRLTEAGFFKALLVKCRTKAEQQLDQTTDDAERQSWQQALQFIDGQVEAANLETQPPLPTQPRRRVPVSLLPALMLALGILIAYLFLSLAVSRDWSVPLLWTSRVQLPTATPLAPELIFRRPERNFFIIPATPTAREYQVKAGQYICAGFRPPVDKPINELEWDNPQELEILPPWAPGVPEDKEGKCQWWVWVPPDAVPRYRISVFDPQDNRTSLGAAVLVVATPAVMPMDTPTPR